MPFCIKTSPEQHIFTIEDDESVLEGAIRQGIGLPYGCRNGFCGSCKGKVVKGSIQYPDKTPPGITEEEVGNGYALFCKARANSDLTIEVSEISIATDLPIKTFPVRVAKIEKLAHDVICLSLTLPATERLQFLAGQYIDVLLKEGKKRSFSFANAPHDDAFLTLHIRQVEAGLFTNYVFNEMQEKALLRIKGPLGTFFLREESKKPIIFVGGGTGFAPLKSMIEHSLHIGLARPMHLFWGVRTEQDLYSELPTTWNKHYDHYHFRYTPVLSEADASWTGATGFVHQTVLEKYPDLSGHQVYMAGPPAMIDVAKADFLKHGLPEDELFYDSFDFST